jgi:hypothetical protein
VLTFSSPGYTSATFNITNSIGTGTVIADVLLTGLVGVVVDGMTGSWYGLNPEAASVSLTKTASGPGPDVIHVSIGKTKKNGIAITSDGPGIQVKIRPNW